MMTPEKRNDDIIWMTDNFNIRVQFSKIFFCVFTIIIDCHFWLLIENYIDDNSFVCNFLQNFIKSKLQLFTWLQHFFKTLLISKEIKIWSDHPISNKYIFFRILQLIIYIFEILLPISIKFRGTILSNWSKAIISLRFTKR